MNDKPTSQSNSPTPEVNPTPRAEPLSPPQPQPPSQPEHRPLPDIPMSQIATSQKSLGGERGTIAVKVKVQNTDN